METGRLQLRDIFQVLSTFQGRSVGTPTTSEHVIQLPYDLDSDPSPQSTSALVTTRSDPTTSGSRPSKRKVSDIIRSMHTHSRFRSQVEEETLPEVHPPSKPPIRPTAAQSSSVSTSRRRSSRKPAPSKRLKIEDTGSIDSPLTSISPPPPSKRLRSKPGRISTPAHSEKSQSVQNDIASPEDDVKDPSVTTLPPTLPKSVPSSPTKLISLTPSKSESSGATVSLKIRLPGRANPLSSVSATSTTQSTSNPETGNAAKTRRAKR
jgi:hypothetical protein